MRAGEKGQLRLPWGWQSRCFAPRTLVQGRASGARRSPRERAQARAAPDVAPSLAGTSVAGSLGLHGGEPGSPSWWVGLPAFPPACFHLAGLVTAGHTLTFFTQDL